ncbi:hypothetical protein SMD44_07037 [Streptomyces alboflavus]|uniref:Uncharacterized protein n=1 Tax=Streptomyces alboflavus TaxID=67267 RepID=A0A1Z1WM90_9ACTN|nr:hypothetical protein SMD44_07037 [Streptomyces alboflavus]
MDRRGLDLFPRLPHGLPHGPGARAGEQVPVVSDPQTQQR